MLDIDHLQEMRHWIDKVQAKISDSAVESLIARFVEVGPNKNKCP